MRRYRGFRDFYIHWARPHQVRTRRGMFWILVAPAIVSLVLSLAVGYYSRHRAEVLKQGVAAGEATRQPGRDD